MSRRRRETYRRPASGAVLTIAPLPADLAQPRDAARTQLLASMIVGGALLALDGALLAWALML